eukprot:1834870-Rhodomonas_salina.1
MAAETLQNTARTARRGRAASGSSDHGALKSWTRCATRAKTARPRVRAAFRTRYDLTWCRRVRDAVTCDEGREWRRRNCTAQADAQCVACSDPTCELGEVLLPCQLFRDAMCVPCPTLPEGAEFSAEGEACFWVCSDGYVLSKDEQFCVRVTTTSSAAPTSSSSSTPSPEEEGTVMLAFSTPVPKP